MEGQPSDTYFELIAEMSEVTSAAAEDEMALSLVSPPNSPLSDMDVSIDQGETQGEAGETCKH